MGFPEHYQDVSETAFDTPLSTYQAELSIQAVHAEAEFITASGSERVERGRAFSETKRLVRRFCQVEDRFLWHIRNGSTPTEAAEQTADWIASNMLENDGGFEAIDDDLRSVELVALALLEEHCDPERDI